MLRGSGCGVGGSGGVVRAAHGVGAAVYSIAGMMCVYVCADV